jgi:hypothetical protein
MLEANERLGVRQRIRVVHRRCQIITTVFALDAHPS